MNFLPYGKTGGASWLTAAGSSGVVHGLAVLLVFGGLNNMFDRQQIEPPAPQFTITLEQLDTNSLIGLTEQSGEAGAEEPPLPDDTVEAPPPADEVTPPEEVPLDPVETPDQIAAVPPEDQPLPDPDPVPPEGGEGMTDDPELPDIPDFSVPFTQLPEDTGPLIPDVVVSTDPGPATGDPEVADPGAPDAADPDGGGDQGDGGVQVAIGPVDPGTVPGGAPVDGTGTAAGERPPPSARDLAIGDLLRRIAAAEADDCLLVLPRRDGDDGIGLAMIAASDAEMTRFADSVLTAEDADIRQTRTLVDPRQCPALSYVRRSADYPAMRLGLRLDSAQVVSGQNLSGVLRGTGGRYVTLALIDVNGVVHDLQRFLSFSGNFARFDVPVNRMADPRDTSQLLLAIATRRPPALWRDRFGQLAQDFFAGLDGEVVDGAALTIATFDVR